MMESFGSCSSLSLWILALAPIWLNVSRLKRPLLRCFTSEPPFVAVRNVLIKHPLQPRECRTMGAQKLVDNDGPASLCQAIYVTRANLGKLAETALETLRSASLGVLEAE